MLLVISLQVVFRICKALYLQKEKQEQAAPILYKKALFQTSNQNTGYNQKIYS